MLEFFGHLLSPSIKKKLKKFSALLFVEHMGIPKASACENVDYFFDNVLHTVGLIAIFVVLFTRFYRERSGCVSLSANV